MRILLPYTHVHALVYRILHDLARNLTEDPFDRPSHLFGAFTLLYIVSFETIHYFVVAALSS